MRLEREVRLADHLSRSIQGRQCHDRDDPPDVFTRRPFSDAFEALVEAILNRRQDGIRPDTGTPPPRLPDEWLGLVCDRAVSLHERRKPALIRRRPVLDLFIVDCPFDRDWVALSPWRTSNE